MGFGDWGSTRKPCRRQLNLPRFEKTADDEEGKSLLTMLSEGYKNNQILVVDDEVGLRDLHQENLEDDGFICFTAGNGPEALDILAVEAIDLAVIDIIMPGMSGLELFELMKDKYPWVAVLFVTAVDQMDVAVARVKGGASDYLVKPVSRTKLIGAVTEALEKF